MPGYRASRDQDPNTAISAAGSAAQACAGEMPRWEFEEGRRSRRRKVQVRSGNVRALLYALTHLYLAVPGNNVFWGVAHPFACA